MLPGHVWYEISDGVKTNSYGLYPESGGELLLHGVLFPVEGQVRTDDSASNPEPVTSRTYSLTQAQFDALKENPTMSPLCHQTTT